MAKRRVNLAEINEAIKCNRFDKIVEYAKINSFRVFKHLIQNNRLDLINELAKHDIFMLEREASLAYKEKRHFIVEYAVKAGIFPHKKYIYQDIEMYSKQNDDEDKDICFKLLDLMYSNECKFNQSDAAIAYENNWLIVTSWLESHAIFLSARRKERIDEKINKKKTAIIYNSNNPDIEVDMEDEED